MHLLILLVAVILIAGLLLWALTQFPIDATMQKLARVVIIVAVVLWLIYELLQMTGTHLPG